MPTDDAVVRYEPRGAHRDLFLCRETEVVAVGRAGSGKTLAASWKLHLTAMRVPNLRGLILRATHTSLTATTLQTFQRQVAARALADGSVRWFGGSGRDPAAFRYANGSTITVAGADRPERFLSLEVDRIFCDEAIELSLNIYETLLTRLRGTADTYRQIVLATNPSYPQHWIKRRADAGVLTMITSTHRDNPYYMQSDGTFTDAGREYMAKLDKLTGVRAQRLREGRWTSAEGVIYESWDDGVHLIDRFAVPNDWRRIVSVDFGYTAPTSIQWWAIDGDGRMYLTREVYATRVLVEDHARHVRRILDETGEPWPDAVVCDHDAEDRATFEKYLGMATTPAKKNVGAGVQAMQTRLRPAGDGKPRLFVFRDALVARDRGLVEAGLPTWFGDEINGYVWAVKPGAGGGGLKEQPLKENDHSMDCARYAVAMLDLVGSARVHSPLRAVRGVSAAAGRYARPIAT